MLRSLHIENIAVVKSADIELDGGFTVLTGETGAGKSVIIDSINMLTGVKVSRDIIRAGESYALSEAVFDSVPDTVKEFLEESGIDVDDGEIVISCKMSTDGKSQTRINGRSVTKSTLREVSRSLVSIQGQNDSHALLNKNTYFELVDTYGDCVILRDAYRGIYKELEGKKRLLRECCLDEEEKLRRKDILEYQIKDIDSKKLKDGEEEALEAEKLRLSHLEKISKHINFADRVLSGGEKGTNVAYMLSRASESLGKISDIIPDAVPLSEKLLDMSYEVSDIAESVKSLIEVDGENTDEKLDKIESRLEVISSLKRRYGRDIRAILEFREKAEKELDDIVLSDENAEKYRQEIEILTKRAEESAEKLSEKRKRAAETASEKILENLIFLDMPKVSFKITVTDSERLTSQGSDSIEFMVATNPGEPMMPMSEIASGGEMSRIMLALKCVLNEKGGVSCSVYDEIDTGISGKTSRKIGIKLYETAKSGQVLCVTHSAQIATLADRHYLISKKEVSGRALTEIKELSEFERVDEAARILGGINITEAQRQAARDMLSEREKQ